MSDPRDATAEAAALRRALQDLRERLLALARVLPVEYVGLLEMSADEIGSSAPGWDLYEGWRDTIDLTVSDVEPELAALWERLERAKTS
jgi:hypothetical protein